VNKILQVVADTKAERGAATVCVVKLPMFWEMFGNDARVAADLLNLTLSIRRDSDGTRVPMAGFPAHRADYYVRKLVEAGHRVAVCEVPEG
jgi:DNA mismatch repair protein MutS